MWWIWWSMLAPISVKQFNVYMYRYSRIHKNMQFLWKNQNAHNMHSALHWKPFFKVPGLPWNYVSSDVAIACIYGRQFISKIKCMIKYALVDIFIITEIIKVLLKAFGKMDWDWTWYFWVLKESAEFHCPSMLNRILLVRSILWDFQRSNLWKEAFWRDDFDWYSITSFKSTHSAMFSL